MVCACIGCRVGVVTAVECKETHFDVAGGLGRRWHRLGGLDAVRAVDTYPEGIGQWILQRRVDALDVVLAKGAVDGRADVRKELVEVLLRVLVREERIVVGLNVEHSAVNVLQGVLHQVVGLERSKTFFPKCGSAGRPSASELAPEQPQQLVHLWSGLDVFREEVRGVDLSSNLPELEVSLPEALLDPERVTLNVSHFAQALSRADAHGSRRIRPHSTWKMHAQIFQ